MARLRRERIMELTRQEIRATARELMAENGAAGLSMRAIGRQMGMTAPALYHYYDGLNDLITALIQEASTRLAKALEEAAEDYSLRTARGRLIAVARTQRRWALANPLDFQLIYGNPIPNYTPPTELTNPPARRSFLVTAGIFTDALESGELRLPKAYNKLPAAIERSLLELTEEEGHDLPLPALYLTAKSWTKIHGHLTLEIFDLIQPVIGDVDAYFEYELKNFLKEVGFLK